MSARNQKKGDRSSGEKWYGSLWLGGLLQLALAFYLALALTGPYAPWWLADSTEGPATLLPAGNPGGPVGAVVNLVLRAVFGAAWCWIFPLLLAAIGCGLLIRQIGTGRWLLRQLVPLWLASVAWIAQPDGPLSYAGAAAWGGLPGVWVSRGFHLLFGMWGGRIFLTFLLVTSLLLLLQPFLAPLGNKLPSSRRLIAAVAEAWRSLRAWLVPLPARMWRSVRRYGSELFRPRAENRTAGDRNRAQTATTARRTDRPRGGSAATELSGRGAEMAGTSSAIAGTHAETADRSTPDKPSRSATAVKSAGANQSRPAASSKQAAGGEQVAPVMPSLELLRTATADVAGPTPADLDSAADLLEDTLRSFGVEGEVKEVKPGPVVATFEYQPAAGIKVSQIVQRADDLALAMKARTIRMEAPIPGKSVVGIEIPNLSAQIVRLREVLDLFGDSFRTPLSVVLGKNVTGRPVAIDLASLPHLLVAGSTGSGKSVCLNGIICNLLLRNDPGQVRLMLIDPKMLEMNVYNGLPHLLHPVVTDPKEALRAIKWMVAQMDLRYRLLAHAGVRNIEAYNRKIVDGTVTDAEGEPITAPMPYYLTIVDELADLMLQLGQEFELPITRLAQKARAVGIHLILATQRPSVDVLTGVIKANIPCRIAFRVIQKNDSRTILDMNGAEQLLGHGDMLYLQPGRALPVRVHGAFIDVDECERIVGHWLQYESLTEPISLAEQSVSGSGHRGEDDLFDAAKKIVVLHQSGSTSLLQRRLRVGYTRAGRLMDMLEEAGIVGPFTGSKARDVLLRPEDLPEFDDSQANEGEA